MRLLQGDLPTALTIGEKEYPIFTDFRNWIQIADILFEEDGSFLEKLPQILTLCYQTLPPTLEDAVGAMVDFYGGTDPRREKAGKTMAPSYSFRQDEDLIYAAFYQQYRIDLVEADLHWWQFRALLAGLSEQTQFSKVVAFRRLDISSVKNPEERRFYRRMKSLHKLTDTRSEVMREEEMSRILSELF